jgi:hypothetical protein
MRPHFGKPLSKLALKVSPVLKMVEISNMAANIFFKDFKNITFKTTLVSKITTVNQPKPKPKKEVYFLVFKMATILKMVE